MLADTGDYREANIESCEKEIIIPFYQPKRDYHNQSIKERFAEPAPFPEGDDAITQMAHRLKTQTGKAFYTKRKSTVEPVFGIIKAVMGFRWRYKMQC